MLHTCNACGRDFIGRDDARFCSTRCRTRSFRRSKSSIVDKKSWPVCLGDKLQEFYYLRSLSSPGALTLKVIFEEYGVDAAKLAIRASIDFYDNKKFGFKFEDTPDWCLLRLNEVKRDTAT
jgi:hypothetical protein